MMVRVVEMRELGRAGCSSVYPTSHDKAFWCRTSWAIPSAELFATFFDFSTSHNCHLLIIEPLKLFRELLILRIPL